jgi:thioredoxin 1
MARFPVLDQQNVAATVARGVVLLDFWQAACPPCLRLEPRLEAFARRHPDAFSGYRIDVERDGQTPSEYDVMSIPTLVWLRDGAEVTRLDGLIRDDDLEASLRIVLDQSAP